jgi:hypothetical protein
MNTTTKQRKEIWGITNRNGKKGYWTRIALEIGGARLRAICMMSPNVQRTLHLRTSG